MTKTSFADAGVQYPPRTGAEPCTDRTEDYFPDSGSSVTQTALACLDCPIVADCLAWALHHEEYGVWGASTAAQRTELRKRYGITLIWRLT